ncbi:MAG: PHP domain-containing protein [Steroidobacteraceae bacterium]
MTGTGRLVDLHTHSRHSDGTLTPEELVSLAASRKLEVLALTDHDTVIGCAAAARACATAGIDFVPGVELSCGWLEREIHVVGLDIDTANPGLAAHLARVLELRRERIRAIADKLRAAGVAADHDLAAEVFAVTDVPTRTHIARRLLELGAARTLQDAFDKHLARGRSGHVRAAWPTLQEAVDVIRGAGGIAVLAHAHRYRLSNGQTDALCAAFRAAGGEGLEVGLAGLSPNDYDRLARLARRHELAGSVASDFHEPGLPWRPLGRFDKLPDQVAPLLARLRPI